MRISFKPKARKDLKQIWNYTVENGSEDQAELYIRQIYQEIEKLASRHSMARKVVHNNKEYLRHKMKHHYIFCRKEKTDLLVIRILHRSMDLSKHL